MLTRQFKIKLDGVALPHALESDTFELLDYPLIFEHSLKPCLEALYAEFGPSLNLYPLTRELSVWIRAINPNVLMLTSGTVFTMLDFFHTKHCPPSFLQDPRSMYDSTEFTQIYSSYIHARATDFFQQSFPIIMVWSAVRHLIPAQVLPKRIVTKQIYTASLPYVDKENIKISLNISSIKLGGYHWLYAQTKHEMTKIKEQLDAQQPCPIILINRSIDLVTHVCVLALEYTEKSKNEIHLTVFDTMTPQQTHQILIDFSMQKLGVITSFTNPERRALQGIICASYQRKKPPTRKGRKWLRIIGIEKIVWWYKGYFFSP